MGESAYTNSKLVLCYVSLHTTQRALAVLARLSAGTGFLAVEHRNVLNDAAPGASASRRSSSVGL